MNDFYKDIAQGIDCIRLVKEILKEKQYLLNYLNERSQPTGRIEYDIARCEYALGITDIKPNRDYYKRGIDYEQ